MDIISQVISSDDVRIVERSVMGTVTRRFIMTDYYGLGFSITDCM